MWTGIFAARPEGPAWRAAAWVCAVILSASVAMALARGRAWEIRPELDGPLGLSGGRRYDRRSRGGEADRQHAPGTAARPLRLADGSDAVSASRCRASPLTPAAARACPPASGTTRSPASWARAAWASSTRRATSGWSARSRSRRCRRWPSDETARKRFWREARAAASVNHPNVCQLYEIGEDGGELFIAMELLEGEPLAERLRRGPLSVSETRADRPRHAGRALGAARPRHRPPRPQAVERVPHAARREAARLRPGAPERPGAGALARLGHAS